MTTDLSHCDDFQSYPWSEMTEKAPVFDCH